MQHASRKGALRTLRSVCGLLLAVAAAPVLHAQVPERAAARAAAGPGYRVEREPAWVVHARETPPVAAADAAPMHYRVIDEQVRVEDRSVTQYHHVVRVVDQAAGLSAASLIELPFDPAYQTLVIHHLEIVRGGQRLNRLDAKRVQLLQRQTQLEGRVLDGRLTFTVVLDDVRVGDEIDFAYGLRGANPVFGGRFVYQTEMGSYRGPVSAYQLRLLAPAARTIQMRNGVAGAQVETEVRGPWRETRLRRSAAPQIAPEPGATYAALLPEEVEFSEFADWADVAAWGQRQFDAAGPQPQVDRQAAAIAASAPDAPARLLAALNFVQREVRYFGTEQGVNSHRPVRPEQTLEQRFGDCKDKVALLVALLRRLDIPATPVLVSTHLRDEVRRRQASPLAFDHVIARVDLAGSTYWLDATRGHQTGPLAQRQAGAYGAGLALEPGTTALAALPRPFDTLFVDVEDRFTVESFTQPLKLRSRVTYRSDLAEMFREALATRSVKEVTADMVERYVRMYPGIRTLAEVQLERSEDDDAITFVHSFELPTTFWRFPEQRVLSGEVGHWAVGQALAVPRSEKRRDPLGFGLAGRHRQVIRMVFPEDVYKEGSRQSADESAPGVELHAEATTQPRSVETVTELRFRAEQVEPAQWTEFNSRLPKLLQRLSQTFTVPTVPLDRLPALGQALKDKEDALRSGKLRVATRVQAEAMFKTVLLDAQIAGGRLPPELQAQARSERGVQLDHQGRAAQAQEDFERALALAPESVEIHNTAAVNALVRGELDRAIALADRAHALSASDTQALNTRAVARYLKSDLEGAEQDLGEILKTREGMQRGYPAVWLGLALRQRGQADALAGRLRAQDLPTEWPRPLVDLALGRTTPQSVLEAARAQKAKAEALCEANFYIAETYRAQGDLRRAEEHWRAAIDQNVLEFMEDAMARLRLTPPAPR